MRNRIASVLVLVSVLAFGAASAASKDRKEFVNVDRETVVGGSVLPAGTYRIDLSTGPDKARFIKGKDVVAEVPCSVGLADVVYSGNAVHYRTQAGDRDRLIKIVFADTKMAVEFPAEAVSASVR